MFRTLVSAWNSSQRTWAHRLTGAALCLSLVACGGGTSGVAPGTIPIGSGSSGGSATSTPSPSGTSGATSGTSASPGATATPAAGGSSTATPAGTPIAQTTTTPAPSSSAASTSDASCLWALNSNEINTLFPDTGATYWTAVLPIPPGGDVRLDGQYPHARYNSFNVYNEQLAPTDAITDFEITPNNGSMNPFPAGANRNAAQRSYSLVIVAAPAPTSPATSAPNTLYAGQPISTTGMSTSANETIIIDRVYINDQGTDLTGGVGLPNITFETSTGQAISGPAACSSSGLSDLPNLASVADPTSDVPVNTSATTNLTWLKFFDLQSSEASRTYGTPLGPVVYETVGSPTSGSGGFASNADNRYISAAISESLGSVVAIHGTFPTAPMTSAGESPMQAANMRYWSLCSNDGNTLVVFSCIYDEQLVRDSQGRGIVLVSMPADRPTNATAACGVTYLNWGTSDNGLLILRNMLPLAQAQFPEAIQYIPGPPGANEQSVMGPYYPYGSHMTTAQFEALGCPVTPDELPSIAGTPP